MPQRPLLLVGGAGHVGRATVRQLHDAHPELPLLIGGRELARAQEVASELRLAEGVRIDLAADDLGLGDAQVAAVAVLLTDDRVAGLRYAQARQVPYISISPGVAEIAPEVAAFVHQPAAAPVVLGTEWLVGATSVPTLDLARAFASVHSIRIGALLDEQDAFGPAAAADLERQTNTMPAALARRAGRWVWRTGDDAQATFRALDGTPMPATALSPHDVLGLAMVTGAPDVQFDLALGESSSRRRGESMSTEIIIALEGVGLDGQPLSTRHAVVHPGGQMPLTGLGVAMVLERLIGLDGRPPTPPGLYFPHQLLDTAEYLARLERSGGAVLPLTTHPARGGQLFPI